MSSGQPATPACGRNWATETARATLRRHDSERLSRTYVLYGREGGVTAQEESTPQETHRPAGRFLGTREPTCSPTHAREAILVKSMPSAAPLDRVVLEPLAEVAPDFTHPIIKKSVTELLKACTDQGKVSRL